MILVRERKDAPAFYINKADLTSTLRSSQPANQGAVKRVRPGGCLEGQEERARSHWSSPLQRPQPSYANKLGSFPPCCCPRQSPASLDTTPFTQRVEDLRCTTHDTWQYGPRPPKRPSLITRQVLHAHCFKPRLLRVPTVRQALGAHAFVGTWGGTLLGSQWGQWGLRSGRACTQKRKKAAGPINQREAGRAAPGSSLLCGLVWGWAGQPSCWWPWLLHQGQGQILTQSSRCCCSGGEWRCLWPGQAKSPLPRPFPSLSQQLLPTVPPHLSPPTGPMLSPIYTLVKPQQLPRQVIRPRIRPQSALDQNQLLSS